MMFKTSDKSSIQDVRIFERRSLSVASMINLVEVKILEHSLNDYVRTLKRRSERFRAEASVLVVN